LELLDERDHLCAWLHVAVASAPGGDRVLARFLALSGNGLFSLLLRLRRRAAYALLRLRLLIITLTIGGI
jgi:hypothetical protein